MLLGNNAPAGHKPARTRLDAAVVSSILAMVALNALVLAGQLTPAKAHAAAPPCRCAVAGVALA